eukprot:TRINITY_DN30040_c0_g1_i2.p1 TRINITY_DN30040_c0_g1~~TRINITY_DN30040_c0_g1_i2.p1  ORF type:complete len:945 (+),score=177.49 TRINITY_DN30040_c0_g1_i2:51-2837(+)
MAVRGDAPVGMITDFAEEQNKGSGSRFGFGDAVYELCEELGSGAAARVYACRRVNTGERFAAKVINLQRMRLMGDFEQHMVKLNREVEILRELHHVRIVNLVDVHQTSGWCYIIMELVTGGELFDQIVKNRSLNETEAKYIFRQLLEGIAYMHSRHVIHRDLKPENILIASSRPAPPPQGGVYRDVKIADFGLSKVVSDSASFAKTFVGTPQYWAPEVLQVQRGGGSYTQAADFWSLGALLYVMLSGRYPFDGKKMPLEVQIQNGAYNMNIAALQNISEDAKAMVRGLLQVNPSERFDLEQCLRHPWVVGCGSFSPHLPPSLQQSSGPTITEVPVSNSSTGDAPMPEVVQQLSQSDVGTLRSGSERDEDTKGPSSEPAPPASRDQVPSLNVNPPAKEVGYQDDAAHETIFCLNELLKLQVSIAGSLEMACLAFRHADVELCEAIRQTFRQARDVSQQATNVVSLYAQVAQQVSQMVLPDLKLAVQEKEPTLALSLLGMVKGWVTSMRGDGEDIQRRYMNLQASVHSLIKRAQLTKQDADRRLGEAVQVVKAEVVPPLSPRSKNLIALAAPPSTGRTTSGSGTSVGSPKEKESPGDSDLARANSAHGGTPISLAPQPAEIAPSGGYNTGNETYVSGSRPYSGDDQSSGKSSALNVPFSMNNWTRQLFDQLTQFSDAASSDSKKGTTGPKEADDGLTKEEAWKRDVVELLFMAPGIVPSQLPRLDDQDRMDAASVDSVFRAEREGKHMNLGDASIKKDAEAAASSDAAAKGSSEVAVVPYVPNQSAQAAAEAMTHSSASLLRALRELKRVDEILQGCSAFWANMDGTVQKLAQMKEHTECLVRFAGNSNPLRERFEQRISEYAGFWSSLDGLCRQYCRDHQAASSRMYEMIREVSDAADVIDTAQSARMCVGMQPLRDVPKRRHNPVVVE